MNFHNSVRGQVVVVGARQAVAIGVLGWRGLFLTACGILLAIPIVVSFAGPGLAGSAAARRPSQSDRCASGHSDF